MKTRIPFLLLISFIIFGCGNAPDQKDNAVTDSLSIQRKLAILDANEDVADTSIKVIRIGVLLNRLSIAYKEPKDTIAEWTSKVKGALHDEGISESCLNILETMNQAGAPKGVKYSDAIKMYALTKYK